MKTHYLFPLPLPWSLNRLTMGLLRKVKYQSKYWSCKNTWTKGCIMPIISMCVRQQIFLVIFTTYDFNSSFHFLRTIKDTPVSFFYQMQLQGSNLKYFKFFNSSFVFFLLISVKIQIHQKPREQILLKDNTSDLPLAY